MEQNCNYNLDIIEQWKLLSVSTYQNRIKGLGKQHNEVLRHHIGNNSHDYFDALYQLWIADSDMYNMDFENAIREYKTLIKQYGNITYDNKAWMPKATIMLADCHIRMGAFDEACKSYKTILDSKHEDYSRCQVYFCIGELNERMGNIDEAKQAYKSAALEIGKDDCDSSYQEIARINLDRLESDQQWVVNDIDDLAIKISNTLINKDSATINLLFAPTHFKFGTGGSEFLYINRKLAIEHLIEDLCKSDITADPLNLQGSGNKRYLITKGWNGKYYNDSVAFIITKAGKSWELSGVMLLSPTKAYSDLLPERKKMTNSPLQIEIKSPWPEGKFFRAGGLAKFIGESALCLFFPPALLGFIARRCGFGIAGYYYNEGTTHHGSHAFAIDFTSYHGGLPFINAAEGTATLAIAEGIIKETIGNFSNGNPDNANKVVVQHLSALEELIFDILHGVMRPVTLGGGITFVPKYQAEHMHLQGPGRIPVSDGMWVRQGTVLGYMDDTGNSLMSHLHFVIQDRDLGFNSVRPTPMDGQTLNDSDSGKCIGSTNRVFI